MQLIYVDGLTNDENERLNKLVSYSVSYNKLWSSDTGRSALTGAFNGTLIGIFPKLTFTVKKHTDAERQLVLQAFNSAYKNIRYWDTEQGGYVTKQFYFGDVTDTIKKAVGNKIMHDALEIEAVATTRR